MFSTLNTYSKDELISFINENKRLANIRLASLERYGNDNTSAYRYIRKKAFTSGQGIQATDEKTRFVKATSKQTRNQLLAEAQNLAGFLASRTSTKSGRDEIFAETVKLNTLDYKLYQGIQQKMIETGVYAELAAAGASLFPPTCGPCAGLHCGLLGDGEVTVTTTNRNGAGRMGSKLAKVYVASAVTAAYSALNGFISCEEK